MCSISSIPNVGLMRRMAWKFSKSTGIPFDDLFQEAYIGYCKCLRMHNADRAKISTYAWRSIENHLINYLRIERRFNKVRTEEDEEDDGIILELEDENSNNFLQNLSCDANEIAHIVLTCPNRFIDQPADKICCRLKNVMEKRGWPRSRTKKAIQELKRSFAN